MKPKNKKHLTLYKQSMNTGSLPNDCAGFCDCARLNMVSQKLLYKVMWPSDEDQMELHETDYSVAFWASGCKTTDPRRIGGFTPLRQTILLFMAAMAGEL